MTRTALLRCSIAGHAEAGAGLVLIRWPVPEFLEGGGQPEHLCGLDCQLVVDLGKLEERAQAAAEATGIPATQLDIAVVPTVTTTGRKTFAPALSMALTPLQLSLTGDESTLTVGGSPATRADASDTPTLSFAGRQLPVSTGRILSLIMVLGALLAAALIGLLARASAPATEAAAIHRRYAPWQRSWCRTRPPPTGTGTGTGISDPSG